MRNLFLSVLFILAAGLVTISSISERLFIWQSVWALAGIFLVIIFASLDLRGVLQHRWLIAGLYIGSVALLIITYLTAPVVRNTRSWLYIGSIGFQPEASIYRALAHNFVFFFLVHRALRADFASAGLGLRFYSIRNMVWISLSFRPAPQEAYRGRPHFCYRGSVSLDVFFGRISKTTYHFGFLSRAKHSHRKLQYYSV